MRLGEFAKAKRHAQVTEPAAKKCSENEKRANKENDEERLPLSRSWKPVRARRRSIMAAEQNGQTDQCESDRE
jgi:hypothetical protein